VTSATTSVIGCATRVAATTVVGSEGTGAVWAWEKAATNANGSTAKGARNEEFNMMRKLKQVLSPSSPTALKR
jgi:hypothetical protein